MYIYVNILLNPQPSTYNAESLLNVCTMPNNKIISSPENNSCIYAFHPEIEGVYSTLPETGERAVSLVARGDVQIVH